MARNADPHPPPDDPNEGPAPHFPPGTNPRKDIDMPRPGSIKEVVPGGDFPPERKPFPDHTPDPGVTHE